MNRNHLTASMLIVLTITANASANLIGHWKFDENPIPIGTTAVDETGNFHGTYSGLFNDLGSTTGHDGVPNSAAEFNGNLELVNVPTPDTGITSFTSEYMLEVWFRPDQYPTGGELFTTFHGGVIERLTFLSNGNIEFNVPEPAGEPAVTNPVIGPAGGWNDGHWYYIAAVLDPNGSQTASLYIYDGVTLWSDTQDRTFPNTGGGSTAKWGGSSGITAALDEAKIFDQAFAGESFLVETLGIPEPASLALFGSGGLLLLSRQTAQAGGLRKGQVRYGRADLERVDQTKNSASTLDV